MRKGRCFFRNPEEGALRKTERQEKEKGARGQKTDDEADAEKYPDDWIDDEDHPREAGGTEAGDRGQPSGKSGRPGDRRRI